MPVQSWGHSHYWQGGGQTVPPATAPRVIAYIPFQIVITIGSGFGAMQAGYEYLVRRLTTTTQGKNDGNRQ